jgi:hypothetical protein
MPAVADTAAISKHWIVSGFNPVFENNALGSIGTVGTDLFDTVDAAKARAQELAAQTPGAYFVIYEAQWYAYPVALRRVGLAAVG